MPLLPLLLAFWSVCAALYLLVARRSLGRLDRRIWSCAARLALIATTPAAATAVAFAAAAPESAWLVGAAASCLAAVPLMGLMVDPSARLRARPADDVDLGQPLPDLAARAGIATPRLSLMPTGGHLAVQAWAGCLPSPVVIVADGLIQRLGPEERAAVIAHELAHHATGSLWWLSLDKPLGALAALLLALVFPPFTALAAGWSLALFLSRMLSRPTELLCDAEAGRHTDPLAMATALRQLHALQGLPQTGRRGLLLHAFSSHPPGSVRIARLRGEPVPATPRRTALLGWSLWGLAWLTLLATSRLGLGPMVWSSFGLLMLRMLPGAPLRWELSRRQQQARARLRSPNPGRGFAWAGFGLLLLSLGGAVSGLLSEGQLQFTLALMILSVSAGAIQMARLRGLLQRLQAALFVSDFERVHALANGAGRLGRDTRVRHNLALALWFRGEEERALRELRSVAETGLQLSRVVLARLLVERDPRAARDEARAAVEQLDWEPGARLVLAESELALGRTQVAREQLRALLEDEPLLGRAMAQLGLVELADQAIDAARAELVRAENHAPGDPRVHELAFGLALLDGDHETARQRLADLESVAEASPLTLVSVCLPRLRARLVEADRASGHNPDAEELESP